MNFVIHNLFKRLLGKLNFLKIMYGIFLDIEATGLDPSIHKVLEIAFKVIDLKSGNEMAAYDAIIKIGVEDWDLRDLESMKINEFTWEKSQEGKDISVVRNEIIAIFNQLKISRENTFYICQNPAFDRNFFSKIVSLNTQEQYKWPYHWLDFASMYWVLRVKAAHEKQEPMPTALNVSKNAIAKAYQIPEETHPHLAINGVNHLILCYKTVVGFE